MVEGLQLAPREERLLKRIVHPEPHGRFKGFFQRQVRGLNDVILAVLVLALVIALLWVVDLGFLESLLGDSVREIIFFVAVFIAIFVRDTRMAVQERLIKSLYGALEQAQIQVNLPNNLERRSTED